MPKRIIDGEALWRSDKLANVQPLWFRAEYANILPLALADGVFECDPKKVWAEVYSYNRPDVTIEDVYAILTEFERVNMLKTFIWKDKKTWGFFVGIDKNGRLPNEKYRKQGRYLCGPKGLKKLISRSTLDNIQQGLGVGLGLGVGGDVSAASSKDPFENFEETSSQDQVIKPTHAAEADAGWNFRTFKVKFVHLTGKTVAKKKECEELYAQLCRKYGEPTILETLEKWVEMKGGKVKLKGYDFASLGFFEECEELIEASQVAEQKPKDFTFKSPFDPQPGEEESKRAMERRLKNG